MIQNKWSSDESIDSDDQEQIQTDRCEHAICQQNNKSLLRQLGKLI